MTFQDVQHTLRQMGDAARGLAAIGAALRLRQEAPDIHPEVARRLHDVVAAVVPGGLGDRDQAQVSASLASVTHALQEARDLLECPERPPVWQVRDPAMLQAQGQASRVVVRRLAALAADRPALAAALTGRFLDVGTGVGGIALEAAAQWPSLRVVGLDIWEPALELARANVAASPFRSRIELRLQDVTQFDDPAGYALTWLPAPFLSQDAARTALDRLTVALEPKGYLVVGLYAPPPDPVGATLAALRLARSGGHLWSCAAMEAELRSRKFTAIETSAGQPVTLMMGRRA
ncbi:methyltransferase type 11 [Methylobacterium sp. XJLW]|uniref:class I SAM-dependent methyltransferase n=1 Tax=Methylobacterium sp. XJLW TaxID=739141 RepID=UPI000DAAFAC0|nr:class I SAM-dependent methyltransferase [Methylobacterium sp. XJLW]AWV19117.1 methyltransferase type 11 [Methylobacterium sp. XJLW]